MGKISWLVKKTAKIVQTASEVGEASAHERGKIKTQVYMKQRKNFYTYYLHGKIIVILYHRRDFKFRFYFNPCNIKVHILGYRPWNHY